MSNVRWITARIAEARNRHTSIPDSVAVRLKDLLAGRLSERQLPPTELSNIADALLTDMVPTPPRAGLKK